MWEWFSLGNFDVILSQHGVEVEWLKRNADGTYSTQGNIKAIIQPTRVEEVLIEPGFTVNDYRRLYTNAYDLTVKDRVVFQGQTWEVISSMLFESSVLGEKYVAAVIRRVMQ